MAAAWSGSSPLARGLPAWPTGVSASGGIIPARAGFTHGQVVIGHRFWDHPRSRGVYVYHTHIPRRGEGSSPLARGLRLIVFAERIAVRIIPARAGFTSSRWSAIMKKSGSSPLARGLLCGDWCYHT
mgnify:CR=1 FL=1